MNVPPWSTHTHVPVWIRETLTGFDAEDLDFGAHVIGSVAQSADVRGDFHRHHAVSHELACFANHLLPVLWGQMHIADENTMHIFTSEEE